MAPQYGRPDSDITQTNWSGGYGTIDEVTYNDSDYITGSSSANGTAEYGLSNVTDPVSSSTHVVRFRAWQQNNTKVRTLNAYLYQGATLVSSYPSTITLVKGTPTAYNWTLSSGEADAITNYTDLRVRFVSGGDVGTPAPNRSSVYVSWSELEVPDAPDTTDDLTAAGITTGAPVLAAPTIGQKHVLTSAGITAGTPDLGAPTLAEAGEAIIDVDLETGDLSEFTSTDTDSGDMHVTASGLAGTGYKLQCDINDTNSMYGTVEITPSTSGIWRARFYFDPNTITWPNSSDTELMVLQGGPTEWGEVVIVKFGKDGSGNYVIQSLVQVDTGSYDSSGLHIISDDVHWIEIELVKNTGGSNGRHRLWIDSLSSAVYDSGATLDNDTKAPDVTYCYVGAFGGVPYSAPGGSLYIDQLVVNDTGEEIGPISAGADDLTATGITTGAPVLAAPTIGQVHVLTSAGITAGTPILDAATIGQEHALTSAGITTGVPVLDAPSVGQTHVLTSAGITTGQPDLEAPDIGQVHALASATITSGEPDLEAPTIGQVHALTSADIATGQPDLEAPTAGQSHVLTADGITAGIPELEAATIGQVHALTSAGITTGVPELDVATISQIHALSADGITTVAPVLGAPTLAEAAGVDELTASDITTGTPVCAQTTLGQIHALISSGITTEAPVFGAPTLSEVAGVDDLIANGITTDIPVFGQPTIGQVHALSGAGIITGLPVLGMPSIGQKHVLTAAGITTGKVAIGRPTLHTDVGFPPGKRTIVVVTEERTLIVGATNRVNITGVHRRTRP